MEDIKTLRAKRGCYKQPTLNELNRDVFIDEWSRILFGRQNTSCDLIRFDCFTTDKYLWDWKGGVKRKENQ